MFPVDFKELQSGTPVKISFRIAGCSPFFGPGVIAYSTGRIQRLAVIKFETKHPFILDYRHLLLKLFLRHLHFAHNHYQLDYLQSIVHMGFVVLGLRAALRAIERSCLVCRKRKASTLNRIMSDLPIKWLDYRHRNFSNCGVVHFT